MNNVLILITTTYPYGNGETFVHNEIPFMDVFDAVLIIPMIAVPKGESRLSPSSKITILTTETLKETTRLGQIKAVCMRALVECIKNLSFGSFAKRISYILHFESEVKAREQAIALAVESFIKECRPQKLIIYSYWLYTQALLAIDLKEILTPFCQDIKCVSRAHGFDVYDERSPIGFLPYREYLLSHLDHIYCCSKQGADYLMKNHPLFTQKISTHYLGVSDEWNDSFPTWSETFHIVTCANISKVKRLDLWIKSLEKINDIPLQWTHIGEGEDFENIKKMADILPNNIHPMFMGSMPNKEVIAFYNRNNVNLFVNTSSSEGLPVSIMEAFSCGIPAIAPNVGGIPEIVENDINGKLFDVNATPDIIAENVRYFSSLDKERYLEFCKQARRKYEERFNDERNYRMFFNSLLTE